MITSNINTLRGTLTEDKAVELSSLLNDPNCIEYTLSCVHATGRLEENFGGLTPPEGNNRT